MTASIFFIIISWLQLKMFPWVVCMADIIQSSTEKETECVWED